MVERHWHWTLVAYDDDPTALGGAGPAVEVTVIGYESEADARIAAQAIVTRTHYGVRRVWECNSCGYLQAQADGLRDVVKAMRE